VRYESALKVVRFLKQHMGEPVSIRRICRGIDLSYQPTYKHVRSLEREGVIQATKTGREVVCELAPSAATTLWLGLASVAERRELLADEGEAGGIVRSVTAWLMAQENHSAFAVALRPRARGEPAWELIVIAPEDRGRLFAGRRKAPEALRQQLAAAAVTVWQEGDFRQVMGRVFERNSLLAQATVLHGEQRFWRLAFCHEAGRAQEEPPPAAPLVRPPRRARRRSQRPGALRPTPPEGQRPSTRPARARRPTDDTLFID
jgi:hypothetical protein